MQDIEKDFDGFIYQLDQRVAHYWDDKLNMPIYDFSKLTIDEIKLEWIKCEKNKHIAHPESAFQNIFNYEMRAIVAELKSRKMNKVK